uniref:Kinesin light chain n=1 Tax=Attheya septentrionalis TaxID=420275 RepID=A0A7S2UEF4_9STRA
MRTTSPVNSVSVEAPNQVLLSIASTLCNIGSIKLRWGEFEEAILALEEALLLQQSVLGDEDPTVLNTVESIDFVDRARISYEENLFEEEFGGCSSINGGGLPDNMSLPGCSGLSDNAGPAVTRMMNINIGLMQNMGFSNRGQRKMNKSMKNRQGNDDGTGQDLHWI